MEPQSYNSTYIVNRRRKEANIHPLQECIQTIDLQLDHLWLLRSSLQQLHLPPIQADIPNLQDLSLSSIIRQQEVTLQEVRANIERSIDTIIGIPEDVDPTSDKWLSLANYKKHNGEQLIANPIIYLPIYFTRVKDRTGTLQSSPINPSDYLPTDEAYFLNTRSLDPVDYLTSSHSSFLQTHRARNYNTSEADSNTNKYFCLDLLPPPEDPSTKHLLPHLGDTYLRNGDPFYKRLSVGDSIYIPKDRTIGKVLSWAQGSVDYQLTWAFSNPTNTVREDDHWYPVGEEESTKTTSLGQFVIALPNAHPTRRLFAHVSPYTAEDSNFLA